MTPRHDSPASVLIIGAGWAGLSAAVRLAQQQIPVTVLEAALHPGGRARGLEMNGLRVDNGQHLLIGAYEATLAMLHTLGMDERKALLRMPLDLTMRSPRQEGINLASLYLPAPLNLAFGLLRTSGIPWSERVAALFGLSRLMRWHSSQDLPVSTLLRHHKIPTRLIEGIFNPLCLAALNTHPDIASGQLFATVLQASFSQRRRHSDLLIPRLDLSAVFVDPARRFIEQHGGRLLTRARVRALDYQGDQGYRVVLDDGEFSAPQVILATPAHITQSLCASLPALQTWASKLKHLDDEPICTVYLRYPEKTRLTPPFIGMLETTGQWLFDRRLTGTPGVMAVVISASGAHLHLDNSALIKQIKAELSLFYPDWPEPLDAFVIREKRATFRASVGCERFRPSHQMPLPGLWLAGDYIQTGLPGTLEGAVLSGLQCAKSIINPKNPS